MFRQKTTVIVGAGASCEIGLPTGDQLKARIIDLLDTTDDNAYGLSNETMLAVVKSKLGQANTIYGGLNPRQRDYDTFKAIARRITRGLPLAVSIDNFLHTHHQDVELVALGKVAIALAILEAERQSALVERQAVALILGYPEGSYGRRPERKLSLSGEQLRAAWYIPFIQLLLAGIERDNIGQAFADLRFVIFNYDRCLEQFLWMAIQAYFDIEPDQAAEIVDATEIIHAYGSLGPLPWQVKDQTQAVDIGVESADVWSIGSRIRTFTESTESGVESQIKSAVETAETIMLLGFGYLDQNVQLLLPGAARSARRVMSTAYKVSDIDQSIIRETMERLGRSEFLRLWLTLEPVHLSSTSSDYSSVLGDPHLT